MLRRLTTWQIQPGKPAKVVPDLATNTGTRSDGADLASIQTPDSRTIVFHLDAPYGDWPWIASMPAFAPVPKADDNPQTYGQKPVASGPYEVKSNQDGTALTLVRNPEWKKSTDPVRSGGPDQIVFKESQDVSTSTQTLIADAGSAQTSFMADYLGAAHLNLVNRNPDAKKRLVTSDAGPLSYLAINTQRDALKDVRVRQALNYAVDEKALIVAQGGPQAATAATTLITPGIPGRVKYDLYPSGPDGDVAKAKKLLAEASTEENPDYDLMLSYWQPDFPSANGNIQPLFASSQIGSGGYNLSRYANPAVDQLIDQATAQTDAAQAQALWAKADKLIMQDAPVVPLTYVKQSFLRGSNVQNFFVASFPAYPNYLAVTLGQ